MVSGKDVAEERGVIGVKVRSENIDFGSGCFPDWDIGLLRTAARVLLSGAGAIAILKGMDRISDPDVAIHGKGILGLACLGNFTYVVAGRVGGEALIGIGAEGFGPRRWANVQGACEVGRNLAVEALLGSGRKVADGTDRTGFVLHLDHDDGVAGAIDFANMMHQRCESALIRFKVGGRVG